MFEQYEEEWVADDELGTQARANTFENFRLVFDTEFMDTIIRRMDDNEAIFKKILDEDDLREFLKDFYARRVYERLRAG